MKILAPISNITEVEKLAEAGADEFYCGLHSKEWQNRYQLFNLNARSMAYANFKDLNDLKEAVETAHSHHKPVYLTLNTSYYIDKQFPKLIEIAEKCVNLGIDGFIVSDLGLISKLGKMNNDVKLHLSTICSVQNIKACLFYEDYNISRITLERLLSIDEIKAIKESLKNNNRKIELEAFVMNTRCINVEAFCNFQHNLNYYKKSKLGFLTRMISKHSNLLSFIKHQPNFLLNFFKNKVGYGDTPPCLSSYNINLVESDSQNKNIVLKNMNSRINSTFKNKIQHTECGVCGLVDFNRMGLDIIKIAGRRFPLNKKVKDVTLIRKAIDIIHKEHKDSEKLEYLKNLFHDSEKVIKCNPSNCFYPKFLNKNGICNTD